MSAATGHERWSKNLDAPINAAPLINNQMIYIGTKYQFTY